MANKTIVKCAFVAALSFGLFTMSCDKWLAMEMGHKMFGRTLGAVEVKISLLCDEGEIKEKDCSEINIRLNNTRALHEKAGSLLANAKYIAENTGEGLDMDAYLELFDGSMEALDNIYDFVKLCGFDLEIDK